MFNDKAYAELKASLFLKRFRIHCALGGIAFFLGGIALCVLGFVYVPKIPGCILVLIGACCLLVPAGFGQGYLVIEDAVMSYKAAEVFYGPGDSGILYDDPDIGIEWPFERIGGRENLIISDKDCELMSLAEYVRKRKEKDGR